MRSSRPSRRCRTSLVRRAGDVPGRLPRLVPVGGLVVAVLGLSGCGGGLMNQQGATVTVTAAPNGARATGADGDGGGGAPMVTASPVGTPSWGGVQSATGAPAAGSKAPAPVPSLPPQTVVPPVPARLAVPAGLVLALQAHATGKQVYECAQQPDGGYGWVYRAPEAALTDDLGAAIGRMAEGPTWIGNDGSQVVGEVQQHEIGPDPMALSWQLLSVRSSSASGTFSDMRAIQRINTVGGTLPPEVPCDTNTAGKVAKVPFQAQYTFYRATQ